MGFEFLCVLPINRWEASSSVTAHLLTGHHTIYIQSGLEPTVASLTHSGVPSVSRAAADVVIAL